MASRWTGEVQVERQEKFLHWKAGKTLGWAGQGEVENVLPWHTLSWHGSVQPRIVFDDLEVFSNLNDSVVLRGLLGTWGSVQAALVIKIFSSSGNCSSCLLVLLTSVFSVWIFFMQTLTFRYLWDQALQSKPTLFVAVLGSPLGEFWGNLSPGATSPAAAWDFKALVWHTGEIVLIYKNSPVSAYQWI